MLDVFYTVDVEIWCDGWSDLDARFPSAFDRHILGRTGMGDFGLPFQQKLLQDHGLQGVFFVEPLFATRFGTRPLQDIVAPLTADDQDVQLHLHTEWVDEAPQPLLTGQHGKRQHLRLFTLQEQQTLIGKGLRLLQDAGAGDITAFRAGNFGFNKDSLTALATHGVRFDSSYNACAMGPTSGLRPGETLVEPVRVGDVMEYPVTVFRDGLGRLRPMQINACSWSEMEEVLWGALEASRRSVVIVSHSFELLDGTRSRPDRTAVRRFRSMCEFLDRHRDSFRARGFARLHGEGVDPQPEPLTVPLHKTAWRLAEQGLRRLTT
jgi:hypothetical protein